ncbi:MAG TPA: response regulator, partial [Bacteroidales bacterium]|nr:response regulator [Bacteroidales bacterium]
MSDKLKVLIVDDESLARDLLKSYLLEMDGIEIAGECENGFEALKAVHELSPDLLFLDIQMPKIDGFELLEVLDPQPGIIFCTAFDQFAIKAFELNAVDYLLKPFSKERLEQAVEKARTRLTIQPEGISVDPGVQQLKQLLDKQEKTLERVITRLGSKVTVIPVDRIHYLEAADDYVMIHSELGRHLKEKTMKYFTEHLPQDRFVRIHRSYIVNLSEIRSLELYSKDS